MTETTHNEHTAKTFDLSFALLSDVRHQDENLFIEAAQRWENSRLGFIELMASTPDVLTSIQMLIRQELALESDQIVLRFNSSADRAQRFISLDNAFGFLLRNPDLAEPGNRPDAIVGLTPAQRLIYPSSMDLLKRLKSLDLNTFHATRWSEYWDARAPGTPSTRWEWATHLYRQHLEAAAHVAQAQSIVSAQELKPALAVVEPAAQPEASEEPIRTQQLNLTRADGSKAHLPGAFVMTVGTVEPVGQLLYLPGAQEALKFFKQRSDMQGWLLQQPQLFPGTTRIDEQCRIDYTSVDTPLEAGIAQWLGLTMDTQLASARQGRNGDMVTVGSDALMVAAQQDRLRQTHCAFAAPPDIAVHESVTELDDAFALFGLMNADIPLSIRRRAVEQQHTLLEIFLGDYFKGSRDDGRLQQLKTAMESLAATEQRASVAASAVLNKKSALQMLELRHLPNVHYSDLYQARREGLRDEANLQRLLNQISTDEYRLLEAVLDHPRAAERSVEVTVAMLTLSATAQGEALAGSHNLDGAMVIAAPEALEKPGSIHSVFLYCPGSHGGLQRFVSRAALEKALFKIASDDNGLALHLSPLQGDPFEFGLQNQLSHCEERVVRVITDHRGSTQAEQKVIELEKLRVETLDALRVPVNEAREQAYAQIIERHHAAILAGQLPTWLSRLSEADRNRFKTSIKAYIQAMKRAQQLLERELPHRDVFSKQRIDDRLRQDFSLSQPFEVALDLPNSTSWQKTPLEGAAPGTPMQNLLVASQQRGQMTLGELAQSNIDNELWWRLSFRKTIVTTDSSAQRKTLLDGLSTPYLRKMTTELDLAQKYEDLIRSTFRGSASAPAFSNEHRREVLTDPWRLMLKMQGDVALHQKHIDEKGWQVFDIAIDACTSEAYTAAGKRIVLLPAQLTVGGEDTNNGPTTLSGVTFIEDRISGLTLLYLPESPDGIFLHQRDSLELARIKLFQLCLHNKMVTYLAGRALKGEVARHVHRINQSLIKNFDSLIGTGVAWPATTSLSAHQLDAHTGRLIEAHRATSRSNDALYLEQCALESGAMFNYLKMALGVVPFVGVAIALYDAWDSANLAVAAFLRGDVGHGLAQLESTLLSLIDAGMDILPGASFGTVANPGTVRTTLSRSRMALHRPSMRKARQVLDRFEGYEYEKEISLAGLQPVTEGLYRNVYRHAEGDFIIRQGRVYQVQLQDRTLRLYGTHLKNYQQPIALDETGHWDTHFAVHGTLFNGGLNGGGNVLGHVADGLDPLWPGAIRQWLPRFWMDRVYRRRGLLSQSIDAMSRQLDNQHGNTNRALKQYLESPEVTRLPGQAAVDAACVNDIELAGRQYAQLEQLLPLSQGNKRAMVKQLKSRAALVIVDRHLHRYDMAIERCLAYLDDIGGVTNTLEAMQSSDVRGRLRLFRQSREIRIKLIQKLDQIDANVAQIAFWRPRIVNDAHKAHVVKSLASLETNLPPIKRDYLKSLNYLTIVSNFERVQDPSWFYLQGNMRLARGLVYDALHAQQDLPNVIATRAQRNRILEECIEAYDRFRRDINVWSTSDGQHFYLDQIPALLTHLQKMTDHARAAIKDGVSTSPGASNNGMRVFETEGNRLMIGVESVDPVTQQSHFITTSEGRVENWLRKADGKFQRQNAPAVLQPEAPTDVGALLAEARARLSGQDKYVTKVRGYVRQNMLPVDLEYMLTNEASELSVRAEHIRSLAPNEAIIAQLIEKAQALTQEGRSLRITQTLRSKTPTQGYLDYLVDAATPDEKIIDIQKVGGLQDLGRNADRQRDFLQEYLIRDLTQEAPQPLWYVHFHFRSATPVFNNFVKAHLKLPEQRKLGLKWQQGQADIGAQVDPIWRGEINSALAAKHFESLF